MKKSDEKVINDKKIKEHIKNRKNNKVILIKKKKTGV